MDDLENKVPDENNESVTEVTNGTENAKEIVNNFISNGVTKEELKSVLLELFPEKTESTETVLDRYILGLKGDGLSKGGEK